jgi:hypothetical protein
MNKQALFQVVFQDGTTYLGGNSYFETKWKDMPDKPIKQISFSLPDNNIIILHDYEAYNHIIEVTQDIYSGSNNSQNMGKVIPRFQYFMGRMGDKVLSYRVTLKQPVKDSGKYQLGDITRRVYEYGKEYDNQATQGWKRGI